jgi:hypothetical protein
VRLSRTHTNTNVFPFSVRMLLCQANTNLFPRRKVVSKVQSAASKLLVQLSQVILVAKGGTVGWKVGHKRDERADRTAWSSSSHSCFVFGRFRVQTSATGPAILIEDFRGFPQFIQASGGIVP